MTDAAVVLALCSVFPPFLLNARTGFSQSSPRLPLFWSSIALALAFRRRAARLSSIPWVSWPLVPC